MASSEELLITLGVQDKGANKQLSALNKELKALDKEYKSASTTTKNFENSQQGLTTKLNLLNQKYTANSAKLDAYKKKLQETTQAIQQQQEKINNMKMNGENTEKAEEQLQKMKNTLRDTERNIQQTTNEMNRLNSEINETGTKLQNLPLKQYKEKMKQLGESVQNAGQHMQNFGQGMQTAGGTLMTLSAPMLAFSAYAIKAGTDFEYAMKQVQATSNASAEELGQLTDKAKEVGENTKWSASDAADALNYMAMAGWKTEQMVAGLEPTVNLATAANTDLGTTCDIVTDALTAFGMSAEDTGHFTDIIAAASSNANTNVELLGESFKYVAPLCGSLGYSAEDSAIALGLMANSGIKASQAGTSLKTALTNMAKPTDTMAMYMDKYNISITDSEGKMKSLKEVMDMLRTNMKHLSDEQINANFEKYAQGIGMTRQELEALSEEEQSEIIARGVGTTVLKSWTDAQKESALTSKFTKEELAKLSKEQKEWQLACMVGKQELYGLSEAEQASAAAAIFGKESMAGMLAIINASDSDYQKLTESIYECDGTCQRMADTMANSTQGKIDSFKSKCEALGIKIADGLLPHINSLLEKAMSLIDWFSNLDSGTQQLIVDMGLMTFATGGLLNTTGKVVSSTGTLVSAVGKLISSSGEASTSVGVLGGALGTLGSIALPLVATLGLVTAGVIAYNESQEALNSKVTESAEDLGFFKTTLLELNGVHKKTKQELIDLGIAYEDLSENISEDFRKALEEATDDVNKFEIRLKEISLDDVLTDEETTEFTSKITSVVDSSIAAINSKKDEAQQSMSDLFKFDDGIIDENEQKIIDLCTKEYETEAEEVRKNQDAINQIYNQARTEGRALTSEEIESIKSYYAQIKQIELECQAENNDELEASKIDFNNRIKNLDAEGASELLQQKKAQLDEELIQKENQYDLLIQKATEASAKLTGAEKEEAEKRIEDLKQKKQETIDTYNSQWDEYMNIVTEKAPAVKDTINKYNGEILSEQDLVTQQGLEKMKAHYDGLNQVTEEGWYKIKDTTDGSITDCYMTVDKNTGEITACYNKTTGEVAGYTEQMKNDVKSLAQEHEADRLSINTALGQIAQAHVNTSNQIVSADGTIIGSLNDVTTSADGVRTGIINVNGTPMQITTNADGVITDMTIVKDSVNEIPKEKDVHINFFQRGLDAIKSMWNSIANKSVSVDANDTGTYSYSGSGISTVDESGWELASNESVQILGSYSGYTLTSIPIGTGIKTHMQSVQDMKYAVQQEVAKAMRNYSNTNNNNFEIDYNKLASIMFSVFKQGLEGVNFETNVNVDADGMITKAVNKTMDKFNRSSKISKISKGR